jgi:hypothetical protein
MRSALNSHTMLTLLFPVSTVLAKERPFQVTRTTAQLGCKAHRLYPSAYFQGMRISDQTMWHHRFLVRRPEAPLVVSQTTAATQDAELHIPSKKGVKQLCTRLLGLRFLHSRLQRHLNPVMEQRTDKIQRSFRGLVIASLSSNSVITPPAKTSSPTTQAYSERTQTNYCRKLFDLRKRENIRKPRFVYSSPFYCASAQS